MARLTIIDDANAWLEFKTMNFQGIKFACIERDFGKALEVGDSYYVKCKGSHIAGGICSVGSAASLTITPSSKTFTVDGDTLTIYTTSEDSGHQQIIHYDTGGSMTLGARSVPESPSGGALYTVASPVVIHNTFDDSYTFHASFGTAPVSSNLSELNLNLNLEGFSSASFTNLGSAEGTLGSVTEASLFYGKFFAAGVITDPFAPEGGPSEPGGGNGTFDGNSDANPIPSDPTISATDTGFMTAFATNLAGIQSVAASLWTDLFDAIKPGGSLAGTVEALKSLVNSPYDAILGCHIIPVTVPVGASKNVKLYGVLPSSVSLPVASTQWVHKDCGSLTIAKFDDSYLDYAPYSKVTSMYLPFIGVVSVDIDIIMGTTVGVYYKIDIISGQCVAFITVDGRVEFQYQGQCAVPLPVTSVDWSTTVSAGLGIIGSVGSIAGTAVGGALGGGGAAGALAGAVKGTIGEAGSIAQNVMNSKPDIKSGSGVGGAAALMGCKNPYLIIERPRKSTPGIDNKYQNHWTGYPANIAARIGSLKGYTEVSRVFINSTTATAEEKQEIEKLLNEGVYL